MKKQGYIGYILQLSLILMLLLTLFSGIQVHGTDHSQFESATPPIISVQKMELNGAQSPIQSYLIEGENYYKLRDLAKILTGTDAEFSITYSPKEKAIHMNNNEKYIPNNSELKPLSKVESIYESFDKLIFSNHEIYISAYKINENNYYKLRDICFYLDIGVGYNHKTKSIQLNTEENFLESAWGQVSEQASNIAYMEYTNSRFNFKTQIPSVFKGVQEPTNSDGITLNDNENATLLSYGSYNMEKSFDRYIDNLEANLKKKFEKVTKTKSKVQNKYNAVEIKPVASSGASESHYIVENKGALFVVYSKLGDPKQTKAIYLQMQPLVYQKMVETMNVAD